MTTPTKRARARRRKGAEPATTIPTEPAAPTPPEPTAHPSPWHSWVCEVYAEGAWCPNGLRFATADEATRYGRGLLMRWFVPTDHRAVTSDEPVSYRYTADGDLVPVGGAS